MTDTTSTTLDRLMDRADAGLRRANIDLVLALDLGDEVRASLALARFSVYLDGLKKLAVLRNMEQVDG